MTLSCDGWRFFVGDERWRLARSGLGIEWAAHGQAAAIENVRIDHRGLDIFMAEELLHRADVVTVFQ